MRICFDYAVDSGIAERVQRPFAIGFALQQHGRAIAAESPYATNLDLGAMKSNQ